MSGGEFAWRSTWADADIDQLGFHDVAVHAIAFEASQPLSWGRLLLDIDYLVEWIAPTSPSGHYSFRICPATLVFHDVQEATGDLDVGGGMDLSINRLAGSDPDSEGVRTWTIDGHEFTLTIRAGGVTLYLRRSAIDAEGQRLTPDERGPVSFDERGYSSNDSSP